MKAAQARALARLGAVVAQSQDWQRQRFLAIIECRGAGLSYAAIADVLGVSRQSVQQFVQAYSDREKGAA